VAHAIVVGFFVLIPVLYQYGIENRLYLYGEITPYTYSDMNGYGHLSGACSGRSRTGFAWEGCSSLCSVRSRDEELSNPCIPLKPPGRGWRD